MQLLPGGYAPRPKDKMERADAAEQKMLSGGVVSGKVVLQAIADKLNKKTDNIRAPANQRVATPSCCASVI